MLNANGTQMKWNFSSQRGRDYNPCRDGTSMSLYNLIEMEDLL